MLGLGVGIVQTINRFITLTSRWILNSDDPPVGGIDYVWDDYSTWDDAQKWKD